MDLDDVIWVADPTADSIYEAEIVAVCHGEGFIVRRIGEQWDGEDIRIRNRMAFWTEEEAAVEFAAMAMNIIESKLYEVRSLEASLGLKRILLRHSQETYAKAVNRLRQIRTRKIQDESE